MKNLELDNFLPYQLVMVADSISRSLAKVYADFDLTTPEWRILAHLQQSDNRTPTELGRLTNMDKARVTRALILMDNKHLVMRTSNSQDKRVVHISLTEQGKQLFQQIEPQVLAWNQNFSHVLPNRKNQLLLDLLKQLNHWCLTHCTSTEEPPKAE